MPGAATYLLLSGFGFALAPATAALALTRATKRSRFIRWRAPLDGVERRFSTAVASNSKGAGGVGTAVFCCAWTIGLLPGFVPSAT